MQLRPGQRLRSQVCETQIIVVRPAETDIILKCGGSLMVDLDSDIQSDSAPQDGLASGNKWVRGMSRRTACWKFS